MSTPPAERVTVVLMAYGTPRTRDEILPYYTDIRRGRPPEPAQLHELTARYDAIGGLSPLAERTEAQRARLLAALDARAPGRFDVLLGTKHAAPRIEDAIASVTAARAVGLVLAPHYSAFSVGQYHERARAAAAARELTYDGIDSWHLLPAYLDFLAAHVYARLAAMPARTQVLFTAHSLPERIVATGDPYPAQLHETAVAIAERAGVAPDGWRIAWQSAGRTPEPWLGPDVLTVIDGLDADGVLVCACGFVADHLEVLYDLDIEAAARAARRGIAFARTACVNDDPAVLAALADTVVGTLAP